MKHLFSWLGTADAQSLLAKSKHPRAKEAMAALWGCRNRRHDPQERGPLEALLGSESFDRVALLHDLPAVVEDVCVSALESAEIDCINVPIIKNPADVDQVFPAFRSALDDTRVSDPEAELHFFLTPGTPTMHAAWVVLSVSGYSASLWQVYDGNEIKRRQPPSGLAGELDKAAVVIQYERAQKILESTTGLGAGFARVIGSSKEIARTKEAAAEFADLPYPVLLRGETGTGKEVFASAIHHASSRVGKFVEVNCATLDPNLASAELFGSWKGAFTGAMDREGRIAEAHQGTLFLDEFGDLPAATQAQLLRSLGGVDGDATAVAVRRVGNAPTAKPPVAMFDVRVVLATNRDLEAMMAAGDFREDLYFRVNQFEVDLPPLRSRGDDVIELARHFIALVDSELAKHRKCDPIGHKLSPKAIHALRGHGWRGNVRELRQVVCRAVIAAGDNTTIRPEHLSLKQDLGGPASILGRPLGAGFSLEEVQAEVARHYIMRAKAESQSRTKAEVERLLGLPRGKLMRHLSSRHGGGIRWEDF